MSITAKDINDVMRSSEMVGSLNVLIGVKTLLGEKYGQATAKAAWHSDRYLSFVGTDNTTLAAQERLATREAMVRAAAFTEALKVVSDAIDRVVAS